MSEAIIHKQICQYIRTQYPDVIFTSEAAGLRVSMGTAKKLKALRSGNRLPDLWILEARNGKHGLLIELKKDCPFTKTGKPKTPHIAEQAETIEALRKRGYEALFCWGFDMAKETIDYYMRWK